MNRRHFITTASAIALAPTGLLAAGTAPLDYEPGVLDRHLGAGEVVFLDFKASWCTTCAAQERVLDKLKAENPSYEENITFINVDWDTYGRSQLVSRMRIPRRSTLVVLKGDDELGRLVADTREAKIRELMDIALRASMDA
ncbi:Thioredoxin [Pseudooceanicola antarcticus]|uniref:Thioredoxin n=1 Tax=Pseudooceanicola antarcticus TaxID=1247613 RepID=A0A285HQ51_9RHOB|nr:thioredoxin family protein [Pseudooceanicola antarcticus]PJE27681.1 thioredoxin [Pseudooceanicola antarcticus]SNY37827.1 Thioredoxin [Pseudooceanicola antarcticus]